MGHGLWVWLEIEMEMAGFGWRGLGFSGFGRGGDRWSGWSFLLVRAKFFWVWSRWRSVVEVVVFVGEVWVFLGVVRVEIGGRGGRFCWKGLGLDRVVVFVGEGWVFLGLIGVEIGGRFRTV